MIFSRGDSTKGRINDEDNSNSGHRSAAEELALARKIALETLEADHQAFEVEARSVFR